MRQLEAALDDSVLDEQGLLPLRFAVSADPVADSATALKKLLDEVSAGIAGLAVLLRSGLAPIARRLGPNSRDALMPFIRELDEYAPRVGSVEVAAAKVADRQANTGR